jgi:DNA-directed RNA polymerase specialized sigma subunit
MAEQELRKLLDQVRSELNHADQLGQAERDQLLSLAADIENRLDPDTPNDDLPLVGGLQDAVERFQVSHPRLTTFISDAISALSNAGI